MSNATQIEFMSKNIEIKARLTKRSAVEPLVARIADSGPEVLVHEDIFFNTNHGRLKLRIFDDSQGELIYYERENQAGPKISTYSRLVVERPRDVRALLSSAYGIRGIVKKQRRVYLVGNTRIHLDEVEGLGEFLELEVVLTPEEQPIAGQKIAEELMTRLGIQNADLVDCAYLDLILSQAKAA